MKNCNGCKYASWDKTKNGRLHPSGYGKCLFGFKIPPLPASWFYITKPNLGGSGIINRKTEFNDHCPYYNYDRGSQ